MKFEDCAEFTRDSYLARPYRFIHAPCKVSEDYDRFYDWLINDWIIKQTDSEKLMYLFIACKFDPKPFIGIVTGGLKKWMKNKLPDSFQGSYKNEDFLK